MDLREVIDPAELGDRAVRRPRAFDEDTDLHALSELREESLPVRRDPARAGRQRTEIRDPQGRSLASTASQEMPFA